MKNKFFLLVFFLVPLLADEAVYNSQFSGDPVSLIRSFVKSILIIIIMLAVFFFLKKILPQSKVVGSSGSYMKIIDKLNLDYTTALYLIEVGNVCQLVTVSNKNIVGLSYFKKSELKLELKGKVASQPIFADYLKKIIKTQPLIKSKKKTAKAGKLK